MGVGRRRLALVGRGLWEAVNGDKPPGSLSSFSMKKPVWPSTFIRGPGLHQRHLIYQHLQGRGLLREKRTGLWAVSGVCVFGKAG